MMKKVDSPWSIGHNRKNAAPGWAFKLMVLLFICWYAPVAAQWKGVSGPAQKNTTTGAYRFNFGASGIFTPAQLNGTGLVRMSGTTVNYDNNNYLITIGGIAAGGVLNGNYPNPGLANNVVGVGNLSASGTPSSTTYLRGDNTWATISGGGGTALNWILVTSYGYVGDGVADDTGAIQAAFDAVPSTGGRVYFPPNTTPLITGEVTVNSPFTSIYGAGGVMWYGGTGLHLPTTTILSNSLTANGIVINAPGCSIDGIAIKNTNSSPTAGAGIKLNDATGFRGSNFSVANFYNNVDIVNGYDWHIDGHFNYNPHNYGLKIADVALADAGDQSLTSSWFYADGNCVAAIRYESGGGLKINNIKINASGGNYQTGISVNINLNTTIFKIINSSIENFTVAGISLGATANFGQISIIGNEFSNGAGADAPSIFIDGQGSDGGQHMSNIMIGSNTLTSGSTRYAIEVKNITYINIGPNTFGSSTMKVKIFDADPNYVDHANIYRNSEYFSITAAPTVTYDINRSNYQVMGLNQNTTVNFANLRNCDHFVLVVYQDGTGGRTVSFSGGVHISGSINLAPDAWSVITFHGDSPYYTIQ